MKSNEAWTKVTGKQKVAGAVAWGMAVAAGTLGIQQLFKPIEAHATPLPPNTRETVPKPKSTTDQESSFNELELHKHQNEPVTIEVVGLSNTKTEPDALNPTSPKISLVMKFIDGEQIHTAVNEFKLIGGDVNPNNNLTRMSIVSVLPPGRQTESFYSTFYRPYPSPKEKKLQVDNTESAWETKGSLVYVGDEEFDLVQGNLEGATEKDKELSALLGNLDDRLGKRELELNLGTDYEHYYPYKTINYNLLFPGDSVDDMLNNYPFFATKAEWKAFQQAMSLPVTAGEYYQQNKSLFASQNSHRPKIENLEASKISLEVSVFPIIKSSFTGDTGKETVLIYDGENIPDDFLKVPSINPQGRNVIVDGQPITFKEGKENDTLLISDREYIVPKGGIVVFLENSVEGWANNNTGAFSPIAGYDGVKIYKP